MTEQEKLLIIVESPSKTKTISKYVENASVIASIGHFKDLPKKEMGIDIDNDFAMKIEGMADKFGRHSLRTTWPNEFVEFLSWHIYYQNLRSNLLSN